MKGLLVILGLLVVLAVPIAQPLLGMVASATADADKRYRLDVELLVNGRPMTASSVQVLRLGGGIEGMGNLINEEVVGQAVFQRIPGRPALLVLLAVDGNQDAYEWLFLEACGITLDDDRNVSRFMAAVAAFEGTCRIPDDKLPDIMALLRPTDPTSLRRADPDNLAAAFGSGVELVGMSLSTTDEPLSRGLRGILTWLPKPFRRGDMDMTAYIQEFARRAKTRDPRLKDIHPLHFVNDLHGNPDLS